MAANDAEIRFKATLDDEVSGKATKLEKQLKKLGASPAEIKMMMKAYDDATPKIKEAQSNINKLPKEHLFNIKANSDDALSKIAGVRKEAETKKIGLSFTDNLDQIRGRLDEMFNVRSRTNIPFMGAMGGGSTTGQIFAMGAAGMAGTGVMGAGISALQQGVALQSELEKANITLTQTLKDSSKAQEEMGQIVDIAQRTPFGFSDVLAADTRLRSYQIPALPGEGGAPGSKIHEEGYLQMAGDMAAAMGTPITQAVEAVADARQGYFVRMMTYGIRMMREDFEKGGKYAGLTYEQGLERAIKRFEGAQLVQSRSFEGITSNLRDVLEHQVIAPAAGPAFLGIKEAATNLQQRFLGPETDMEGNLLEDTPENRELQQQAFDFQRNLGAQVGKVQEGFGKLFDMIQKGRQYFEANLQEPLMNITESVVKLGKIFAEAFGGVSLSAVKTIVEALTTVAEAVASVANEVPGLVKLYGIMKALSMLGLTGIADPIMNLINPVRTLQGGFRGLLSSVGALPGVLSKLGLLLVAKQMWDTHQATKALEKQFNTSGSEGKKAFAELNSELERMSDNLARSNRDVKNLATTFARELPQEMPDDVKGQMTERATFLSAQAQNITGVKEEDVAQLMGMEIRRLSEDKDPSNDIRSAYDPKGSDTALRKLRDEATAAAGALSEFGVTTSTIQKMIGEPGAKLGFESPMELATIGGAWHGAKDVPLSEDQLSRGIYNVNEMMKRMTETFAAPDIGSLQRVGLNRVSEFYDFSRRDMPGMTARDAVTGDPAYPKDSPGEAFRLRQTQYQANEERGRELQAQVARLAPDATIPEVANPWIERGMGTNFEKIRQADSGREQAQVILQEWSENEKNLTGIMEKVAALDDRINRLRGTTQVYQQGLESLQIQMTEWQQDNLVPVQRDIEDVQIQMAAWQQENIVPVQRSLEDAQLRVAEFQFNLRHMQRAIEDQQLSIQEYQFRHLRPLERQMNRLSQATSEVGNQMRIAQYEMNKYSSGLLNGEQAALNQLHALERYNKELQLLQLLHQQIGGDLTQTTYERGYASTVEPMMGLSLQMQMERAQREQSVAQSEYDLNYGEKHYRMEQAGRSEFERQEMGFKRRLSGIRDNVSVIDEATRAQHRMANQQFRLQTRMFRVNENIADQQDQLTKLQLRMQRINQSGEFRQMTDDVQRYQLALQRLQSSDEMRNMQDSMANLQLRLQRLQASDTFRNLTDQQADLQLALQKANVELARQEVNVEKWRSLVDDLRSQGEDLGSLFHGLFEVPEDPAEQLRNMLDFFQALPEKHGGISDEMADAMWAGYTEEVRERADETEEMLKGAGMDGGASFVDQVKNAIIGMFTGDFWRSALGFDTFETVIAQMVTMIASVSAAITALGAAVVTMRVGGFKAAGALLNNTVMAGRLGAGAARTSDAMARTAGRFDEAAEGGSRVAQVGRGFFNSQANRFAGFAEDPARAVSNLGGPWWQGVRNSTPLQAARISMATNVGRIAGIPGAAATGGASIPLMGRMAGNWAQNFTSWRSMIRDIGQHFDKWTTGADKFAESSDRIKGAVPGFTKVADTIEHGGKLYERGSGLAVTAARVNLDGAKEVKGIYKELAKEADKAARAAIKSAGVGSDAERAARATAAGLRREFRAAGAAVSGERAILRDARRAARMAGERLPGIRGGGGVAGAMGQISDFLKPLEGPFKALGKAVSPVAKAFTSITDVLAKAASPVVKAFRAIADSPVGKVLGKIALPVGIGLDALAAFTGEGRTKSAGIGGLTGTAVGAGIGMIGGPVGMAGGAAIGGIAGYVIGHFLPEIKKAFAFIGDKIGDFLNNTGIGKAIKWFGNAIADAVDWLWEGIKPAARGIWAAMKWVGNAVADAVSFLAGGVKGAFKGIKAAANWVIGVMEDLGMIKAIKWLGNAIADAAHVAWKVLKWIGNRIADAAHLSWKAIKLIGNAIADVAHDVWKEIQRIANSIADAAHEVWKGIRWLGSKFGDAGDWIADRAHDVWKGLQNGFGWIKRAGNWIADRAHDVWEFMKKGFNWIGRAGGWVADKFKDLGSMVLDAITGMVNWIIDRWNSVAPGFLELGHVGSAGGVVLNKGRELGEYRGSTQGPARRAGGMDRVPYDDYEARLHKDEAVLQAAEAHRWRQSDRGAKSVSAPSSSQDSEVGTDDQKREHKKWEDFKAKHLEQIERFTRDHYDKEDKKQDRQFSLLNRRADNFRDRDFKSTRRHLDDVEKKTREYQDKEQKLFDNHYKKRMDRTQRHHDNEQDSVQKHGSQTDSVNKRNTGNWHSTYDKGWNKIHGTTKSWIGKVAKEVGNIDKSLGLTDDKDKDGGGSKGNKNKASGGLIEAALGAGQLVRVGEEGFDEVIIPLAPHRRNRAVELTKQTIGRIGGLREDVQKFANGGIAEAKSGRDMAYDTAKSAYKQASAMMDFANGGLTKTCDTPGCPGHGRTFTAFANGGLAKGDNKKKGRIDKDDRVKDHPEHNCHKHSHERLQVGPSDYLPDWVIDQLPMYAMGGTVPGIHPVIRIAQRKFALALTSGLRVGDDGDHGWGGAADLSNGSSPTPQMDGFSNFSKKYLSGLLGQLIWRDRIQAGRYTGSHVGGHMNHVHFAIDRKWSNKEQEVAQIVAKAAKGVPFGSLMGKGGMALDLPDVPKSLKEHGPIGRKYYELLEQKVKEWESSGVGAGDDDWNGKCGPVSSKQARAWVTEGLKLAKHPVTEKNISDLMYQAKTESGWDPCAQNNWDSNAAKGTPSIGFLQTIGPTFDANKVPGHNNIKNPVHNIAAAIRYMLRTYGHLISHGSGYAQGLDRVPYDNFAAKLHKDEAVLPAAEAASYRAARGRSGDGGGKDYGFNDASRAFERWMKTQKHQEKMEDKLDKMIDKSKRIEDRLEELKKGSDRYKENKEDLRKINQDIRARRGQIKREEEDEAEALSDMILRHGDISGGEGTLAAVTDLENLFNMTIDKREKSNKSYKRVNRRYRKNVKKGRQMVRKFERGGSANGKKLSDNERKRLKKQRKKVRSYRRRGNEVEENIEARAAREFMRNMAKDGVNPALVESVTGSDMTRKQLRKFSGWEKDSRTDYRARDDRRERRERERRRRDRERRDRDFQRQTLDALNRIASKDTTVNLTANIDRNGKVRTTRRANRRRAR